MNHDVFISHSSEDRVFSDAICTAFEKTEIGCWIAPRDIPVGSNWADAIIDAINGCKLVIVLFTSNSNNSAQVAREVERAAHKRRVIVVFRLENVPFSNTLEYFLSSSQWVDAIAPPLDIHIDRFAETVKLLLSREGKYLSVLDKALELIQARNAATEELGRKIVEPLFSELQPLVDDYFDLFRCARTAIGRDDIDMEQALADLRRRREAMLTARIRVREWARSFQGAAHDRRLSVFAENICGFFFSTQFSQRINESSEALILIDMLESLSNRKCDKNTIRSHIGETLRQLEQRWANIAQSHARLHLFYLPSGGVDSDSSHTSNDANNAGDEESNGAGNR